MSRFDRQLWRDRAWRRFETALRTGRPRSAEKAEAAWAKDVLAISDLSQLVSWCDEHHVRVDFVRRSLGVYHGSSVIHVSSRLRPLRQAIVLLHECGHHLVGESPTSDRFVAGYASSADDAVRRTMRHRLACLEEEFEAWWRGWRLARRLRLSTTREDFDEVRVSCLRTYLGWALTPGDWEETSHDGDVDGGGGGGGVGGGADGGPGGDGRLTGDDVRPPGDVGGDVGALDAGAVDGLDGP